MLAAKKGKKPDPIPEISYDPPIVEMTQKMELNYKEIIADGDSDKCISAPATNNGKKITGHSIKRFFFAKKTVPDEYVKPSSAVCMIDSIPTLEKELKLQDIHSNCTLKRQIAEGAQGVVWTAFDKSLRRDVIVKSIKPGSPKKQMREDASLFVSEARIIAQLDHPSIVPIYGMYSGSESKLHLTMKHVHGKTLQNYLQSIAFLYERDGIEKFAEKKSILTRIEYLLRVCEAVDYAHCKGVIHRDLKPENIIIGNHSEVYVMDWGLACLMNPGEFPDDKYMAEVGTHSRSELVGTPCYIAPELIRGELCSPQSDIFSLGMILFEIVTLERAALGKTIGEVLSNIVHCNYRPFKHRFLKSRLPDDLRAIIAKATCESLSKRYKTAKDMAEDLKSYLMHSETAARPDNLSRKCFRAIGNHAVLASSVILSVLLCLTIIALYGLHGQNILVKKQKAMESMLTHFQVGVIERSSDLDHAIHYFETQLTNMVKHCEYVLNDKAGNWDSKKLVIAEIIKHMMLVSNFTFEKRKEHSGKQLSKNSGVPIKQIFVSFKNGSILSYPRKKNALRDYNLCKSSWYKEALNKKDGIIWSQPFMCVACSKKVLCCLLRIFDKENKPLGVVGINIDLAYIQKYLVNNAVPGMKKYLLNKKGEVILSSDFKYEAAKINPETKTLILKKITFRKEFQRAVKRRSIQFGAIRYNRKYLFGINPIPELDYYYVEQILEKKLQEIHKKHIHPAL